MQKNIKINEMLNTVINFEINRAVFENGETPTDGTEVTVVKVDGNKLIVKK